MQFSNFVPIFYHTHEYHDVRQSGRSHPGLINFFRYSDNGGFSGEGKITAIQTIHALVSRPEYFTTENGG